MQQKTAKNYFKLLPLSLILLIVPLIVYLKVVSLDDVVVKYWSGTKQIIDLFSYYKMAWFVTLTCISVLFFIWFIVTKNVTLSLSKMFIPLVVYFIFVFLSSALSEFHTQAFFGFPDRYEGFFTIFCYILVCFLCSVLIDSKFDIRYLFTFLSVSVFIISIIGITQFFGFDFLQTDLGKTIMLHDSNQKLADAVSFKFPDKYIYSTLYNPNYVGGFFAMILPISIIVFILASKIHHKIIAGLFCILSFINLLGSLSSTGYISTAISGIILLIYLRKDLKRNCLPLISLVLCFGVITAVMNYTSGGVILRELNISSYVPYNKIKTNLVSLVNITKNTITSNTSSKEDLNNLNSSTVSSTSKDSKFTNLNLRNLPQTPNFDNAENKKLDIQNISIDSNTVSGELADIQIDKNNLLLYMSKTDALVIKYDSVSSELLFYDNKGKDIEFISNMVDDKVVLTFNDIRFQSLQISVKNNLVSVESLYSMFTPFNLIINKSGFKFITPSGRITDITKAESFGFVGKEKWGSFRGYIWSRSIPMIKNTILIGHGPDTYAMFFPQNDYVAKMKYINGMYTTIDKPHNLYLQIAINTGLLSLIAFLIFVGWYCIASLRLYFKGLYNQYFTPGIACFIAVISFLISSIANDSTVSVSPVFWILLGTGIACNRLYLKNLLKDDIGK